MTTYEKDIGATSLRYLEKKRKKGEEKVKNTAEIQDLHFYEKRGNVKSAFFSLVLSLSIKLGKGFHESPNWTECNVH